MQATQTEPDRGLVGRVIADYPAPQYRQAPGMNASGLKNILESPGYYKSQLHQPITPSPAMVLGTLTHLAVLEPHIFADARLDGPKHMQVAIEGDGQPTRCTKEAYEKAKLMAASVMANPSAKRLLAHGAAEVSCWWRDPVHELDCKGRLDFISEATEVPVAIDLKTTQEVDRDAFSRTMVQSRYDLQAAHYCAAGQELGTWSGDRFVFIAVQNKAPFRCMVYTVGFGHASGENTSVLDIGSMWREYALRVYKRCRQRDEWPVPEMEAIKLPYWAKTPQDLIQSGELEDV